MTVIFYYKLSMSDSRFSEPGFGVGISFALLGITFAALHTYLELAEDHFALVSFLQS